MNIRLNTTITSLHHSYILHKILLPVEHYMYVTRNILNSQHTPRLNLAVTNYYCLQFVRPILSRANCAPCTGLVSRLANIFSVPKCSIITSPFSTLSVNQKCLMLMCLERSDPGPPRFIRAMQLMLSWYTIAGPMSYPWPCTKFLR